jgi:hypothetical protein
MLNMYKRYVVRIPVTPYPWLLHCYNVQKTRSALLLIIKLDDLAWFIYFNQNPVLASKGVLYVLAMISCMYVPKNYLLSLISQNLYFFVLFVPI